MSLSLFSIWILAYIAGIVAITLIIVDWRQFRKKETKAELFFIGSLILPLISISIMGFFYLEFLTRWGINPASLISILFGDLIAVTVQFWIQAVLKSGINKIVLIVVIVFASAAAVAEIGLYIGQDQALFLKIVFTTFGILSTSILTAGIFLIAYKFPEYDFTQKRIYKSIGIIAVCSLPFFILFDFFGSLIKVIHHNIYKKYYIYPVYFIIICIQLIILHLHNLNAIMGGKISSKIKLSKREYELMLLLTKGKTYTEIAQELFISVSTVKSHTNKIYKKTGAKNRIELIQYIKD